MATKKKILQTLMNTFTALSLIEDESNSEEIELERKRLLEILQALKSDENEAESK